MDSYLTLIGQYRTALNRVQLSYATLLLWNHPDIPSTFEAIYDATDSNVQFFPQVKQLVRDETSMRIACEDLYMLSYRSALTDLFELTKSYCHATKQLDKLKAQPWFPFWRILRNCFAHEMIFNFNPTEKAMLPVSWSGVTLDLSLDGKNLTHGRMSYAKMLELIEAANDFVHQNVA